MARYKRYKYKRFLRRIKFKWFMFGLMVGCGSVLLVALVAPSGSVGFTEKIKGDIPTLQEADVLVAPALQEADVAPEVEAVPELETIDITGIEVLMLDLVNFIRGKEGVGSSLAFDAYLYGLACEHSKWMAETGNLEHSSYLVWECILYYPDYGESNSEIAGEAIGVWMRSPEHRAILMEPSLIRVGIGVARSGTAIYATFCAN